MKNLVTDEYRELLAWEHENTPGKWGHTASMYISDILIHSEGRTHWLDYGAGHGGLQIAIKAKCPNRFIITEYEPSRTDEMIPIPHEYVVCIDVLEHVEPELIENVLDDLKRVTIDKGYFTISCRTAKKILRDGRNAHLIVKGPYWWIPRLSNRFIIDSVVYTRHKSLRVVVYNKGFSKKYK